MRIILFIISFILLAEAGIYSNVNKKETVLVSLTAEGATEEEPPEGKDSLNSDKQFAGTYIYDNKYYKQKQNYALSVKYNLSFESHPIFSPPPEC